MNATDLFRNLFISVSHSAIFSSFKCFWGKFCAFIFSFFGGFFGIFTSVHSFPQTYPLFGACC